MNDESKAAAISGTLDWCNEQRAGRGLEALEALPPGKRGDALSCPCGKATGLSVGMYSAYDPAIDSPMQGLTTRVDLPSSVCDFVRMFDAGELPQFDEALA